MNSGNDSRASTQHRIEPIAIIGMSCRFPGAQDIEAFWRLLSEGTDAITEVPPERFDVSVLYDSNPGQPGKLVTRWGGFLKDVDRFDNSFFGISPREADAMDPQQRLFLEVAWEALEDAGQLPSELAGKDTGVFVGIMTSDYDDLQYYRTDRASIDLYATTGGYRSVVPGRLSFLLDLRGPSMAVDTGCSSSLVAIHLACQSILTGECGLALAGGTNMVLAPERSMGFSRAAMLAPDGRCKFADSGADGFVRSEGIGIVVLKALSKALEHRDPVHAVILASAVNHDGFSSGSMSTPGRSSQEDLLRMAYRRAGISPGSVVYVEAHGTGTNVGDPIEIGALAAVLSENRAPEQPCLIGSVKSNIGHTEAAAGVAGLIKTALILKQREIPPTIHLKSLNANIPWEKAQLTVPRELTPLPAYGGAAIAGVNSFGIAGTNAHVVLQAAAPELYSGQESFPAKKPQVLTFSATHPLSLRTLATRYQAYVRENAGALSLGDLCYTRNVRRTHHDYRLAMMVSSCEDVDENLGAFLAEEARLGISAGQVESERQKLVFVFPGHGSQWYSMGQQLLRHQKAFREKMEECHEAFRKKANWSLMDEINVAESQSRLNDIDVVQYVLFSMGISLSALWQSWGIFPDAVIGHSMGEVAAAHIAGVLPLTDAVQIMYSRGHLLKRKAGLGAMAVVDLPIRDTQAFLDRFTGELVIAGSNTRGSSVVSGSSSAIVDLLRDLQARSIFARKVRIDYASHSPQMDDVCEELREEISGVVPLAPKIPIYSTVQGGLSKTPFGDADHWVRNLRQPVLFGLAVEALLQDGYRHFLELSPHPILLAAIQQAFHDRKCEGRTIPSLRRQAAEEETLLSSLGTLYTLGHPANWEHILPDHRCKCIQLPPYAWQSERFWRDDAQINSCTQTGTSIPIKSRAETKALDGVESIASKLSLTRDDLSKADDTGRKILLQSYLMNILGQVLQQSPSKLDANRSLIKLGVDSLMALELKNRIERDLRAVIPIMKIIMARSVTLLAALVLAEFAAQTGTDHPQQETTRPATTDQTQAQV